MTKPKKRSFTKMKQTETLTFKIVKSELRQCATLTQLQVSNSALLTTFFFLPGTYYYLKRKKRKLRQMPFYHIYFKFSQFYVSLFKEKIMYAPFPICKSFLYSLTITLCLLKKAITICYL